jgi:hypothetical protein
MLGRLFLVVCHLSRAKKAPKRLLEGDDESHRLRAVSRSGFGISLARLLDGVNRQVAAVLIVGLVSEDLHDESRLLRQRGHLLAESGSRVSVRMLLTPVVPLFVESGLGSLDGACLPSLAADEPVVTLVVGICEGAAEASVNGRVTQDLMGQGLGEDLRRKDLHLFVENRLHEWVTGHEVRAGAGTEVAALRGNVPPASWEFLDLHSQPRLLPFLGGVVVGVVDGENEGCSRWEEDILPCALEHAFGVIQVFCGEVKVAYPGRLGRGGGDLAAAGSPDDGEARGHGPGHGEVSF